MAIRRARAVVTVVEAKRSDAGQLRRLLDDYVRELSGYRDVPVNAGDAAGYQYLELYWKEPGRHAFLLLRRKRAIGFALVRGPDSTGTGVFQLAEFYVTPENRSLGIGRRAALAVFRRFPGQWELQVQVRNSAAVRFWASCTQEVACNRSERVEVQGDDGRRLRFNFEVGGAA